MDICFSDVGQLAPFTKHCGSESGNVQLLVWGRGRVCRPQASEGSTGLPFPS